MTHISVPACFNTLAMSINHPGLDLGGCWLSEVNIAIMDGQGLYLSILISYRKFLGDKSSKQVASIVNDKGSECVKCF